MFRFLGAGAMAGGVVLALACSLAGDPLAHVRDVETLLSRGRYYEAELRARSALEERASTGRERARSTLANLLVRALVLNGRASSADTRELAERTMRAQERAGGAAAPQLADALVNLGDVLSAGAEYEQAVAAAERALAIRRAPPTHDGMRIAETLDHLGRTLTAARRYDEALTVLDESLQLKERQPAADDASLAETLQASARALQGKGEYAKARDVLQRASAIHERVDPSHPRYIDCLDLLHLQLWFDGKLRESRNMAVKAVSLAERTLRPDHPSLARSLRYLAGAEWSVGDLAGAHALWARAYALARQNFGDDHHETAMYLHDVALADLYLGDYLAARTRFARAAELFESRYGPAHDFVATALHNLSLVDARLGDWPQAKREQARATAIWEQTLGADHPYVALGLTELAAVLREQGAIADALTSLERALEIRERALGPDHRDVAQTLADLATTSMLAGRTQRAYELSSRAVRIWERQDTPDAPDVASGLALYADLLLNRGSVLEARRAYERVVAIRERVFGRSHPAFAEAEAGLAQTLLQSGHRAEALRLASHAEATGLGHLRLMLRHLPERQSLNYAGSRPRGLDIMLSLTAARFGSATEALDATIRSRAVVLDEIAARGRALEKGGAGALQLQAALVSARQRLANLLVRGPGDMTAEQYTALVDDALRESERAEQELAERSAEFSAELRRAHIGSTDVIDALPAASALVAFVKYNRVPLGDRPRAVPGGAGGVASYLAFALRSGRSPVAVSLGNANDIERLVTAWRAELRRAGESRVVEAGAGRSGAVGGQLRARVWDPLTPHIRGVDRVFLVADGALGLVPFAALPTGDSFVLEQAPPIHYLTAERDLVSSPGGSTAPTHGMLALGGPTFDEVAHSTGAVPTPPNPPANATPDRSTLRTTAAACGNVESLRFKPLDGTLQEVHELSRVWTGGTSETARVLVGREADETTFKQDASRYRVLHLATHGFFLNSACATPATAASGTRGIGGLARTGPAGPVENPLLLSGLALAGANRRAAAGPDDDDGILTAEEVASLDLRGVEWAVLSACDTGVGEIKAGEGVFGLRRAFQVAGARTVIMSLWSVDDQATRAWMRALYAGRFQRQLSTADAVHQASLAVLQDRRAKGQSTHPFYWAAFVAAGEWR